jgi:hypothetical protein
MMIDVAACDVSLDAAKDRCHWREVVRARARVLRTRASYAMFNVIIM